MNPFNQSTRRSFLQTTGKIVAVSALAGVKIPAVHAAGSERINAALIGCGGRGTGAASNAMSVSGPPIELVAMADVFDDKMKGSIDSLKGKHAAQFKVTPETAFVGFDAYKKAIDVLKAGDIVMMAPPPSSAMRMAATPSPSPG